MQEFLPHLVYILYGALVTLKYSIIGILFGFIIGTSLAFCKISDSKTLKLLADGYTSIFRGTPLLVQLSLIYFGLPALLGIKFSVFFSGSLAFSLNSGAYVSEIIRSGLNAVDKGQSEAAKVLGVPTYLRVKDIILPQAIRFILPALVNELINLVKESAIISFIGELDLMGRARLVSSQTYDFFTPMISVAIAYYIIVLTISSIAKLIEKRLST